MERPDAPSWVLAIALVAGASLAAQRADAWRRDRAPSERSLDPVRVEVQGVLNSPDETLHAVLLAPPSGEIVVPVFVEADEAAAIDRRLRREPGAEELVDSVIRMLGGRVEKVVVDDAEPESAHGRLIVVQGDSRHDFSASGGVSIAVALSQQAPIFLDPRVLGTSGLTRAELDALRKGESGAREPEAAPPDTSEDVRL